MHIILRLNAVESGGCERILTGLQNPGVQNAKSPLLMLSSRKRNWNVYSAQNWETSHGWVRLNSQSSKCWVCSSKQDWERFPNEFKPYFSDSAAGKLWHICCKWPAGKKEEKNTNAQQPTADHRAFDLHRFLSHQGLILMGPDYQVRWKDWSWKYLYAVQSWLAYQSNAKAPLFGWASYLPWTWK